MCLVTNLRNINQEWKHIERYAGSNENLLRCNHHNIASGMGYLPNSKKKDPSSKFQIQSSESNKYTSCFLNFGILA